MISTNFDDRVGFNHAVRNTTEYILTGNTTRRVAKNVHEALPVTSTFVASVRKRVLSKNKS